MTECIPGGGGSYQKRYHQFCTYPTGACAGGKWEEGLNPQYPRGLAPNCALPTHVATITTSPPLAYSGDDGGGSIISKKTADEYSPIAAAK